MVLLEAMSFGTPCISFDCPSGPGDILTSGEDGVLVEPEDVEGLARAMDTLIDNPVQRDTLGQQARITAQAYRIDQIAAQWHRLFTTLVARNG